MRMTSLHPNMNEADCGPVPGRYSRERLSTVAQPQKALTPFSRLLITVDIVQLSFSLFNDVVCGEFRLISLSQHSGDLEHLQSF